MTFNWRIALSNLRNFDENYRLMAFKRTLQSDEFAEADQFLQQSYIREAYHLLPKSLQTVFVVAHENAVIIACPAGTIENHRALVGCFNNKSFTLYGTKNRGVGSAEQVKKAYDRKAEVLQKLAYVFGQVFDADGVAEDIKPVIKDTMNTIAMPGRDPVPVDIEILGQP